MVYLTHSLPDDICLRYVVLQRDCLSGNLFLFCLLFIYRIDDEWLLQSDIIIVHWLFVLLRLLFCFSLFLFFVFLELNIEFYCFILLIYSVFYFEVNQY